MVAIFLLDMVLHRRYRTLVIWGALLGALIAVTSLQIGFWVPDFLDEVLFYSTEREPSMPADSLGLHALVYILPVLVCLWAAWVVFTTRHMKEKMRTLWLVVATVLAAAIVLPQMHNYTMLYLIIPMWLLVWYGRKNRLGLLLMAGVTILSYVMHFEYELKPDHHEPMMFYQIGLSLGLMALLSVVLIKNREQSAAPT